MSADGDAPALAPSANQVSSAYRDLRKNVEINVGKTCNNKCVFCIDGMPTKEDLAFIDFGVMKAELERWRAEGHLSVGFLGGEPTTYPKIVESVAYAKELGFTRIALATNAMMLRRMEFLDKLLAAGLTRVTISMHGHQKKLEDELVMVPGAFEKKCTAIRNLLQRKREGHLADGVSVNIVLNAKNGPHLLGMMKFFFDTMGLDDLRVNFVRPEGYAEGNADLVPTYTATVPLLLKAILLNEYHFKKTFTFGGFPLCVLPEELLRSRNLLSKYCGDIFRDLSTDCSIRADGEYGIATFEGGRARFNWQDRKRFDLKHHTDACSRCALTEVCEGVWRGYLDIYGDSEVAPLVWERGAAHRHAPRVTDAPARRVGVKRGSAKVRLVVLDRE
ncbi:MAG: radical SAM protein [Sandaracinus sp.]